MFILEYSICKSADGLENWKDFRVSGADREELRVLRNKIREENRGTMIVFEDVYETTKEYRMGAFDGESQ